MITSAIKLARAVQKNVCRICIQRHVFRKAIICGALGFSIMPCVAEKLEDFLVNPYAANDQAVVARGGDLFGRNCQQCHNTRGKGGKAPQLIRGAWGPGGANSDAYMFNTINAGRPGTEMGAWGTSLSPDEIWAIITFLRAEAVKAKIADEQDDE